MAAKKKNNKKGIENYTHKGKKRTNNPPSGLGKKEKDDGEVKKTYKRDPHIDPSMEWAGKKEGGSFEVPTVSLHVHERIDPKTIIEAVRKKNGSAQGEFFFEQKEQNPPLRKAVEFYKHEEGWSNRLIAGDSLLVMNSLLEKESFRGKVQMVYIDPPYGIKYGSNFQPFVNNKEVKDGQDLTTEPEMRKAFRDTWELGIHSYLSYLRDRLRLSRKLLTKSGSCFVQIGNENVHRVAAMMDEVFGAKNRIATISYATTSGSSAGTLPEVASYLLWYAKDKKRVKYRQLYEPLTRAEVIDFFSWHVMVELADGESRKLTGEERFDPGKYLPKGARIYMRRPLDSQGVSISGRSEPYEWKGRTFHCGNDRQWSVSMEGLDRLAELGRLEAQEGQTSLRWKNYEDEVPGRRINNIWVAQASPSGKRYVVETAPKIIQRCMLMTTDPGDVVFDPTCGSGTTAVVGEEWGRRWITCDTSRVAIAIARQRLMTANFDYYALAHAGEGIGSGLRYRGVAAVSARTLAYDEKPAETLLYDQPIKDTSKARVTGPFTCEAVPAPVVRPLGKAAPSEDEGTSEVTGEMPDNSIGRSGETLRQAEWRDELKRTGICDRGGQRLFIENMTALSAMYALHAEGSIKTEGG
ncbi:MAG: site-specific DNA-methyltransferase, partial [Alphaproteobacteria bacterium]